MMQRTFLHWPGVAVAGALLAACASSAVSLVDIWKDTGYQPRRFTKVLVVGVTSRLDRRQTFEDIFARKLNGKGIEAVPSYFVIATGEALTRDTLSEAVRRSGADGVLLTSMIDIMEETKVRPGVATVVRKPVSAYPTADQDTAQPYYNDLYQQYAETIAYEPPTVITSYEAILETKLFDASTAKMVWSGKVTSRDVRNLGNVTNGLADIVIKELGKEGLL